METIDNLLDVWNIDKANPEYEMYVKRAEEIVKEKNRPENVAKIRKQSAKNENKYRRPKVRR